MLVVFLWRQLLFLRRCVSFLHVRAVCVAGACKYQFEEIRTFSPMKVTCDQGHQVVWKSSPSLPNGRPLDNYRLVHAILSSGLMPVQYERFFPASGIGFVGDSALDSITDGFATTAVDLAEES